MLYIVPSPIFDQTKRNRFMKVESSKSEDCRRERNTFQYQTKSLKIKRHMITHHPEVLPSRALEGWLMEIRDIRCKPLAQSPMHR